MTTARTITAGDRKSKGMTLDDLAEFVQDAMRADMPGTTVLAATVTWSQKLQTITITTPKP